MPEYNGTMLQYFHWYTPGNGHLWKQLIQEAGPLAARGFTSLWLPPPFKGAGGKNDVGYGVYDLYDLGEFNQKKSIPTKYGSRDDYLKAIKTAQAAGLHVYADIVMNHKMGGDREETFKATAYNPDNRKEPMGEMETIRAWTHFSFPGRKGKYSPFEWHWWHFDAGDHNAGQPDRKAVYLFEGKTFDTGVDPEKGNFDYLMGCDLDFENPEVRSELLAWGEWFLDTTGIDGFRFDAVKHVKAEFFKEWLNHLCTFSGRDLFAVGEYWSGNMSLLEDFLKTTEGRIKLFDTGLHFSFADAGRKGKEYDLRTLFDTSLVRSNPDVCVTFVSNHDTQPLQQLESVVEPWFVPLAYALILLRQDGYPCVFTADYFGADYQGTGKDGSRQTIRLPAHKDILDCLLKTRRSHAYGEQRDYFDHANCVGWVRDGTQDHPGGIAVVLSNDAAGQKTMQTHRPETIFRDFTGHIGETVKTGVDGWGDFRCPERSVSVWIPERKQ